MPLVYDPTDPAVRRDPFPLYRRLRDEDPIHFSPVIKSWVITRYEDIRRVTLSDSLSADRLQDFYAVLPTPAQRTLAEVVRYLSLWVAFRDPPEHRRLRKLISNSINPRVAARLEPAIHRVVNDLVTALPAGETVDIIRSFAMPLPAIVIMDMLGVPRDRMDEIKSWSNDLALFIGTARNVPDKYERARRGMQQMAAFFRDLIGERRVSPGEDVLSQLIAARDENDSLTEDELVSTCILILFAGHETTTNLIGNAVHMLLTHPDEMARLRQNPDLIDTAIEEFLRFDGPSNSLCRMVSEGHELNGRSLKKGDRVFAMLNAGNRDERAFDRADVLDLARDPNRHLTFGSGIHFCLGAPLARLEARAAITALVERFPLMRLGDTPPVWHDALIMRGMGQFAVSLGSPSSGLGKVPQRAIA